MDDTDATGVGGDDRDRPVSVGSREAFERLVAAEPLVLVAFVTPGCGICASMEPVLGAVARAAPGVVAVVDASEVPEPAREFDVRAAPTLVVLRDGAEVERLDEGFYGAERLVETLTAHAP
ncbi:MAG: thioredoxin family protein [Haloferacaceae archaeon]|jgi:thiol-disulfide isomerase/thioredoxin